MKGTFTTILILIFDISFAQTPRDEKFIREGNDFYRNQQYDRAVESYDKAVNTEPNDLVARFNQANAVYKQDQKVEAAKIYTSIINGTDKKELKAKTFYNKGVLLSREKNIEESIEAYKNALRNDPTDKDARENLQKALLELKRKPPPPKKENKKDNKKQQQQQQKQQQSKMSLKETDQRLQLLQQKEKEVEQRMQKEKSRSGGSQPKDW
jgi:Ca-activated chloride channel family protein